MPVGEGLNFQNISSLLGSGASFINAIRGNAPAAQTRQVAFNQGGATGGAQAQLAQLAQALQVQSSPGVRERLADFIDPAEAVRGGICAIPTASGRASFPATVQGLVRTETGSQRVVTYRNMGTPLLYSGDLAAVARVKRASSRANKACPTRRATRRGRR